MNIKFEVRNHVGWITLDRPEKLNALSYEMIKELHQQLILWKDQNDVYFICLEGSGEKAFSAGGDVVHLYEKKDNQILDYAYDFFYTEYCMNMLMHLYPKPIVTYMNGIVMGGGVGVAVAGSHRIVNEKTQWAMPEMNIGLYPDVGGSFFLNRAPGHLGRYLALTSKSIKPMDVLHINAADYYMKSQQWTKLKALFHIFEWSENVTAELEYLITQHESIIDSGSELETMQEIIDEYFKYDSVEEIMNSLKSSDEWGKKTHDLLSQKSPSSLKVTLEQIIRGKSLDIRECLMMELNMSMNFMKNHDFFEGVRAVLVDKDKTPLWKPIGLEDISSEAVNDYFEYDWKGHHPLKNT